MNKTMGQSFTAACVQNCAINNTDQSVTECVSLIESAHNQGADLIVLPEFCAHLHVEGKVFETGAAPESAHAALATFSDISRSLSTWILIGSVAVVDQNGNKRNRSFLIDPSGEVTARYDKIHMFDVSLNDGEVYRESDTFTAGDKAVIADTPFARLGLTVCYDLRFAALYRILSQSGANVLTVPAAFTHTTGKAHWHVLLRARAIETGSFVIAPCQYGYHGKARTFGHSLIIDPWGEILAEGAEDTADVVLAEIELEKVTQARLRIPALEHDRPLSLAEQYTTHYVKRKGAAG
ncbi:MAG: carbon-nitrogen hydrolase family protein [bacterium]